MARATPAAISPRPCATPATTRWSITGAAKRLVYLLIDGDQVEVRPADAMAGMDTIETGRVIRDQIEGAGHRSILRIGPAGERRIRYANVNVDTFRHFGRLGLGAVLGSKNLKAVAVVGQKHAGPAGRLRAPTKRPTPRSTTRCCTPTP